MVYGPMVAIFFTYFQQIRLSLTYSPTRSDFGEKSLGGHVDVLEK